MAEPHLRAATPGRLRGVPVKATITAGECAPPRTTYGGRLSLSLSSAGFVTSNPIWMSHRPDAHLQRPGDLAVAPPLGHFSRRISGIFSIGSLSVAILASSPWLGGGQHHGQLPDTRSASQCEAGV